MPDGTAISLNIHLRDNASFPVGEFDDFVSVSLGGFGQHIFLQNINQAMAFLEAAMQAARIMLVREEARREETVHEVDTVT